MPSHVETVIESALRSVRGEYDEVETVLEDEIPDLQATLAKVWLFLVFFGF